MKHIYKGQTKLRLILETKCDLTGYTEARIKYRKPCGTESSFPATVTEVTEGVLIYDVTTSDSFDQEGFWLFWPEVTFSDDSKVYGRSQSVYVYPEGA